MLESAILKIGIEVIVMKRFFRSKNDIIIQLINSFEVQYRVINICVAITMFLAGILLLQSKSATSLPNAMLSFVVAFSGILLDLLRKHLSIQFKITVTMIFLSTYTINLILDYGLHSAGLLGLALIVVLSSIYLDKISGLAVILVAALFLGGFTFYIFQSDFLLRNAVKELHLNKSVWVFQTLTFWLFILVTYVSVHTIKTRLVKNIEDLMKSEIRLKHMAFYDEVTGLYNRNYFEKELAQHLNGYIGQPFFMALMDIKNFRLINNMFGNEQGDRLLEDIAKELKNIENDKTVFARIGSNEFIMIAFDWDISMFREFVSHTMIEVMNSTQRLSGLPRQQFLITYLEDTYNEMNFIRAIKNLSIAIKYGKEHGLVGIIPYETKMSDEYEKETLLLAEIEQALLQDQFEVHYQGKWSIEKNSFSGFEALVRWKKGGHYISPMVFIPIVMKSQTWIKFSEIIFIKAIEGFEDYLEHSKEKEEFTLSINISPTFFSHPNFNAFALNVIEGSKVNYQQIIFEITEEIFITDIEVLNRKIHQLREKGIRISLDDFGTGYSSLGHLNSLTIDELKIDRSFVREIDRNKKSQVLLAGIIEIAKEMNYSIVAEGVERVEEKEVLEALGCCNIQGYYYSKPQSIEAWHENC